MNHTKLVEMLKATTKETFLNEMSHGARYGRQIGGKTSSLKMRYKPDKSPQLAEEDIDTQEKTKTKSGTTDTGKTANKIITEPVYQSQMSPTHGSKPSIETK